MGIRRNIATVSTGLLGLVAVSALAVSLTFNQEASAVVPGVNQLVSQSTGGIPANAVSSVTNHSISSDGRYVVFDSSATNLTPEATGGVFVRDTANNTTLMASLSDAGVPVVGTNAKISYDGRYVVFTSSAANVVAGTSTGQHVYVRDLKNNTTAIADVNATGTISSQSKQPDINADGRYVVFVSSDRAMTGIPTGTTSREQIIVKDMVSGKIRNLTGHSSPSQAFGNNYPSIDCSGRTVTFISNNQYLGTPYPGQGQTGVEVYAATWDWDSQTVVRAGANGEMSTTANSPSQVSCNGNHLTWPANRDNPYSSTKYDVLTKIRSIASLNDSGAISNQTYANGARIGASTISDDGRYVAFTNKGTNLDSTRPQTYKGTDCDVFVRDTKAGTTNLVSFTALGNHSGRVGCEVGSISISPDGSTIAYSYNTPDPTNPNGELVSGVNTGQRDVYISKTGF